MWACLIERPLAGTLWGLPMRSQVVLSTKGDTVVHGANEEGLQKLRVHRGFVATNGKEHTMLGFLEPGLLE